MQVEFTETPPCVVRWVLLGVCSGCYTARLARMQYSINAEPIIPYGMSVFPNLYPRRLHSLTQLAETQNASRVFFMALRRLLALQEDPLRVKHQTCSLRGKDQAACTALEVTALTSPTYSVL